MPFYVLFETLADLIQELQLAGLPGPYVDRHELDLFSTAKTNTGDRLALHELVAILKIEPIEELGDPDGIATRTLYHLHRGKVFGCRLVPGLFGLDSNLASGPVFLDEPEPGGQRHVRIVSAETPLSNKNALQDAGRSEQENKGTGT